MKSFRPLGDNVLVKLPPEKKQTDSGIILPDTAATEKPQQGVVVAIGPGRRLESGEQIPMRVDVGQEVLFGTYAGIEMKIQDQKFLVVREDDLLLHAVDEPDETTD